MGSTELIIFWLQKTEQFLDQPNNYKILITNMIYNDSFRSLKFMSILQYSVSSSQKTPCLSFTKMNQLMLFMK
jgi:hypothetical protein